MTRVVNFNPGPAALPESVLKKAQEAMWEIPGVGTGVMEISHRSPEFEQTLADIKARMRRLLGLGEDMHILFCQGGARTQFAMIPMNFLHNGPAAYIDTGNWANSAINEAKLFGDVRVPASSEAQQYDHIPAFSKDWLQGDESYFHITSNNTIYGTQWHQWPSSGDVPYIVDMSSDIASREVDMSQFDLVYAGAQKNLGAAGVTMVFIKDEFAKRAQDAHLPSMMRYKTFIDSDSLYNTPPVFNIYLVGLVLEWIEESGGVAAIAAANQAKASNLYAMIDGNPDFFRGTVKTNSRSEMNITFRLPTEALEKQLVSEAKKAGFLGIKGHRVVGGIRVSNYNAVTLDGMNQFIDFCNAFAKQHGV